MRKHEVRVGEVYAVAVGGRMAPVKIVGESPYGGWDGVNTRTNRTIRLRSARRLQHTWETHEAVRSVLRERATAYRIAREGDTGTGDEA